MSNKNGQKLAGKVAVVTGGSSGVGAAIAKRMATDGASVAVTHSKGPDAATSVVKAIERAGGRAIAIQAEAADADAVKAAVEKAVATFGRLDILVNNVGTAIPKKFEEMQAQKAGSIINVSSTLGHRGAPGASLYGASKHAVEGLTQSAALEGASFGVRVNCVAPGPTDTGLLARFSGTPKKKAMLITGVPLNRLGTPEELAAAIVFMASPKAAFINGTTLVVDGGKLAR